MDMPPRIFIGANKAFTDGYAFEYNLMHSGSSNSDYQCATTTETGWSNEVLFLLTVDEDGATWHIACEGSVASDGARSIRQACFRTSTNFWEAGWHNWVCNTNRGRRRNPSGAVAEWDLENVLGCEAKLSLG
jgi:hypothetical protein